MKIEKSVLEVLSVSAVEANKLTLPGTLDRQLYVKVNKVLEAAGGKWDKKEKCHVFECDAESRVEQMIATGDIEVPKDEFNYFPTPRKIVDILIEESNLKTGMSVLEPSAGQGSIANVCAKYGAEVDCYELMGANFKKLSENSELRNLKHGDFLLQQPEAIYDRVIMNPPFLKQADIKHVTHALKFLKTGGKLVAVMSGGVTFRNNKLTSEFRDLVATRGGTIEPLPEGSFKESGTMVSTVMVSIPN